jgi:hypothetical protein
VREGKIRKSAHKQGRERISKTGTHTKGKDLIELNEESDEHIQNTDLHACAAAANNAISEC